MHGDRLAFDVHPRDARSLDLVSRGALLPGSWIGYIRYGAAGVVWTPPDCEPPETFWVLFPLRGHSEIATKTERLECSPTRSAVYPSGLAHRSGEGSERVTFQVSKATLIRQLEALLGDPPVRKLEFMPSLDLETPFGRRLRRHVSRVIADFDDAGPEGINPTMLTMYEQLIVTELLVGQPHNYTAALHGLENKIAPGDVKRAIDFIEANVQQPLTLTDIARASRVPGRTLLEHFKLHRGVSPMRYVRNTRLARVRDALMRGDRSESVTEVATEWGFTHLGRFAVEYREQFGESPSETLQRSRARRV
jgi:AraC-like DNA-binding protein